MDSAGARDGGDVVVGWSDAMLSLFPLLLLPLWQRSLNLKSPHPRLHKRPRDPIISQDIIPPFQRHMLNIRARAIADSNVRSLNQLRGAKGDCVGAGF